MRDRKETTNTARDDVDRPDAPGGADRAKPAELPLVSDLVGGVQLAGRPGGAGQSAGGPYPNPHSGKQDRSAQADDKEALTNGGYFGGGQQGGRNWSGKDHHAASKGEPGKRT